MNKAIFLIVLLAIFLIGLPIAFSLGVVSMLIMFFSNGIKWAIIIQQMIGGVNTFTLLAVPLFLIAGKLMNTSGITDRLFNFAKVLVGWLPGGLGHVNVVSSMIFAGMSGTAVSDAGGLGLIEIKAMKDAGFDNDFACSVTAASSTIGPIIPPSLPLVIYGTVSGASVGALFMAGILPGILLGITMMIVVFFYSKKKHYPCEKFPSIAAFVKGLKEGILPLMAPVIILLGIYTGIFTPTEAAAIVVFYSLFLGMVVYREITIKDIYNVLLETVRDSATIGLLVGGSALFGNIIIRAMIPQTLLNMVTQSISSPAMLLLILNVFLLIVGMFMETTAAITIIIPLVLPLLNAMHINLVHFGIILVLNLMIGVMSPPFGIVLFVTSRIGDISIVKLSKALIPWMGAMIAALLIITYIPEISLLLPRLMGLAV